MELTNDVPESKPLIVPTDQRLSQRLMAWDAQTGGGMSTGMHYARLADDVGSEGGT